MRNFLLGWIPAALLGGSLLLGGCSAASQRESAAPTDPVLWITFGGVPADANLPSLDPDRATWKGTAVVASSDPPAAIASLLTGAGVWHHGLWTSSLPEPVVLPTLAQALSERGYRTTALIPRELQRPEFGLTAGFDRVEPVPPISRLARIVEALGQGEMLWIHLPDADFARAAREVEIPLSRLLIYADPKISLPPEMRHEIERVSHRRIVQLDRKLSRLLGAAPPDVLLLATATHGLEIGQNGQILSGENLGRAAIEVPCWLRLPGSGEPLRVDPGERIAQGRLWATFAARLDLDTPPLLAPGLQRPAKKPIFSELYLTNGLNRFSLLDGDLQLLFDVPFAPAEAEYYLAKQVRAGGGRKLRESPTVIFARLREAFRRTPPLGGNPSFGPPRTRLVRWGLQGAAATKIDEIEDREIESRLVAELARRRSRFLVRELSPVDELRIHATRGPTSVTVP